MARRYRKINWSQKPPRPKPLMGTDRYECPTHGFICDGIKGAEAFCPCGRTAKVTLKGEERNES